MIGAVETAAWAELDRRLDPNAGHPIAVAVSGGGDSVALLRLTHAWAERAGRRLLVLTVDHGLQPDSAGWSRTVAEEAARLGHPARTMRWMGPERAAGLPAAARAARHALLAEAAREAGARVILLGHTADDAAEAEWMRREGSTLGRLRAWSPSPVWPEGRGLMLLRPLLALTRADLRAWLSAQGAPWLEDPANTDGRFARARARAALAGEGRPPHAGRPELTPASDASKEGADLFTAVPGAPAALRGERAGLLALSEPHAVLNAALLCASGRSRPARGHAVQALLARLRAGEAFSATLAYAHVQAGEWVLTLSRDPGRGGLPRTSVEPGRPVVWDGRFELVSEASGTLRPAAGVLSRLSPPDRRTLAAVPAFHRGTLPVLETETGRLVLQRAVALAPERLRLALGPPPNERSIP